MLKEFLKPKNYCEKQLNVIKDVCDGIPVAAFGLCKNAKCDLISSFNTNFLYVVRDEVLARDIYEEIKELNDEKIVFLPSKDDVVLYRQTIGKEKIYSRLAALYEIKKGARGVITTVEALLQLFPKEIISYTLKRGEEVDLYNFASKLIKIGYRRVDYVELKGQFSIRGDILEIYPINLDDIYRVDFFGDDIESIRVYGEGKELDQIDIVMATDVLINEDEVDFIKAELKSELYEYRYSMNRGKANNLYLNLVEKLESDLLDDSLQYVFPLIKNSTHNIFNFLSDDCVVCIDEDKLVYENLLNITKEFTERVNGLKRVGDTLKVVDKQYIEKNKFIKYLTSHRLLSVMSLNTICPFTNPLRTYNFKTGIISRYSFDYKDFITDISLWLKNKYNIAISIGENDSAFLFQEIHKNGLDMNLYPDISLGIYYTNEYIPSGYICHDNKLVVIGANDLFPKAKSKRIKKGRNNLYEAPVVGDFVVHEVFGIGLIKGVKRLSFTEGSKDFVEIEYAGGDKVYVSTDQMDRLSKYLGGEGVPTLNRIGNGEFEKLKNKVRATLSQLTINLKKLYKDRGAQNGFVFEEDNEISKEFYDSFPYEETEDQIESWEEIKEDMESSKIMDRLLCGDVGFGKTEVAFRACLKSIISGKQAAIIAPTTILTEQHYMTAKERFSKTGINIEVLNRFRSSKEQREIIEKINSGKIDLIIGTHRLLNKEIQFKDLGLLVIDEEQRFGVEQKEKIKDRFPLIDTLSLSATPIPRTLHMSLSGIRDISTINTPPKERIPVQVVVTELTDDVIVSAINKEMARNGQVFILYNKVNTIEHFTNKVRNLIPNKKIIYAHGQMDEKQLEERIVSFYKGDGDILIATTIIENGIDIPRANTLIVCGADHLGLSTLYQIKGRVGRSNSLAYAYFTYDENKVLSEDAVKRLTALTEFSEMGSGYKIAMRDLEIRGAGNILGREQHGHMEKVGYELYSKLLKEELDVVTRNREIELEIKDDAYIPERYIENEQGRMTAYKTIAEISNEEEMNRIINSLIDTYGPIPSSVMELINIAHLKYVAKGFGCVKLIIARSIAKAIFRDLDCFKDGILLERVKGFSSAKLAFSNYPAIEFMEPSGMPDKEIKLMLDFFLLK